MKHTILVCSLVLLLMVPGFTEETKDIFILPETPPTIERLSDSKLDQPVLKKQSFISDISLEMSHLWPEPRFGSVSYEDHPLSLGLSIGSYGFLGANFGFVSRNGWLFDYSTGHNDGEFENLASDSTKFLFKVDLPVFNKVLSFVRLRSYQKSFWTQSSASYGADTGAVFYPVDKVNIKTNISLQRAEIKNLDENDELKCDVRAVWQHWPGSELSLLASYVKDTGFAAHDTYEFVELDYSHMFLPGAVIRAGGSYDAGKYFCNTSLIWNFLPRARASVSYCPGFEKKTWSALYDSFHFVSTNRDILWPENTYCLKEKVSYYWSDESHAELEFYQKSVVNSLDWVQTGNTLFVSPVNIPERKMTGCSFAFRHNGNVFSHTIELERAFEDNVLMRAPFTVKGSLEAKVYSWTIGVGHEYISPRYFTAAMDTKLEFYRNTSVHLKKKIDTGLELYAAAENVLSEIIELQPGFMIRSPSFEGGIKLNF